MRLADRRLEVVMELGSSLELAEVTSRVFPALSRLIATDYGALCLSDPHHPGAYTWVAAALPEAWFAGYAEMAPHDFVRRAVIEQPNVVLRDGEMIGRQALVQSPLYVRCRELGVPLEQVMAVLVDLGDGSHGGVTLYRDLHRPFSDRDRATLQSLLVPFARAIRNCRRYRGAARLSDALGHLLDRRGVGVLVVTSTGVEVTRNERATLFLERWFGLPERAGLPPSIVRAIALVAAGQPVSPRQLARGADLRISIERIPEPLGAALWLIELHEGAGAVTGPPAWREALAPREYEVAELTLNGLDRNEISARLGCKPETVKEYMRRVHAKLGLTHAGRGALQRLARAGG